MIYNLCAANYDDFYRVPPTSKKPKKKALKHSSGQTNNRTSNDAYFFRIASFKAAQSREWRQLGRWFLWVPSSTCAARHRHRSPSSQDYKNGEIPLTSCCFCLNCCFFASRTVLFYDRTSSRKPALEAWFPGNLAIYSKFVRVCARVDSIILVAWNSPLTSMKLYNYCPLLCWEAVQKKFCWLPPPTKFTCDKCQFASFASPLKCHFVFMFIKQKQSFPQEENPVKTNNQNTTSTNTFQPNLCKSLREPHKGKISTSLLFPPSPFQKHPWKAAG